MKVLIDFTSNPINFIFYMLTWTNLTIIQVPTQSEKQGGRFHQDVMDFERRYQGLYNENMMGGFIWGLIRECPYKHKKIPKNIHFWTWFFIILHLYAIVSLWRDYWFYHVCFGHLQKLKSFNIFLKIPNLKYFFFFLGQ